MDPLPGHRPCTKPTWRRRATTKSAMSSASSTGVSPCTLWPASSTARSARWGTDGGARPRRCRPPPTVAASPGPASTGTLSRSTASQRFANRGPASASPAAGSPRFKVPGVAPHPSPVLLLDGVVQDPPAKRRDGPRRVVLDRPGQDRVESPENWLGPRTKSVMAFAFSALTPGVTSTSTSSPDQLRVSVGKRQGRHPPIDIPITAPAPGASASMTTATSSAVVGRFRPTWRGPSECPWPGRSMAKSGRAKAKATVSQVWAFWAPPWRKHQLRVLLTPDERSSVGGRHPSAPSGAPTVGGPP